MPEIIFVRYGSCPEGSPYNPVTPPTAGPPSRVVQFIQDLAGTGVLKWTENSGVLPLNLENVDVLQNGKELEYIAEYTITPNSGPGESTITILFPIPGFYYKIVAYYF